MKDKQIHKALKAKGLSWVAAGKALDCTYQHVMNVCARRADSSRVAKGVALLIDKPVEKVFPDKPNYHTKEDNSKEATISAARERLAEAGLLAEAS